MIMDPVISRKSASCDQRSITKMVEEIQSYYEILDLRRRHMFIEWLRAHSSRVKTASNVFDVLTAWFESMPYENLWWEYRLIMNEIDWWGNLDEHSLTKIMLADLARNGA